MIYLRLFMSFLQIGLFSFGGGYAALPLIQEQIVELHGWLSQSEFTDLITISQMTPGPIAVNAATFVGIRVAGIPGAVTATLGCIFHSCVIVSILAFLYLKYKNLRILQGVLNILRPAVVAIIASAGVTILISAFWGEAKAITPGNIKLNMAVLFLAAIYLLKRKNWNPILVMVLCGILNAVISLAAGFCQ